MYVLQMAHCLPLHKILHVQKIELAAASITFVEASAFYLLTKICSRDLAIVSNFVLRICISDWREYKFVKLEIRRIKILKSV
jgi:hypothetical protein